MAVGEIRRFDEGPGQIFVAVLDVAFAFLLAIAGAHAVDAARVRRKVSDLGKPIDRAGFQNNDGGERRPDARHAGQRPSAPKLAARQSRALRESLELGPGDHRMDAAAEAAIGRGDDAFTADAFGEAQNALGDEFGVLHHAGGVTDDAGQNELAVGQFDVPPYIPLVFVTDVAGFERVGLAVHRQHDVDNIAHRDIGGVRPVPAAPA